MNAYRRKQIARIIDLLEEAYIILDDVKDEEEDAYNNIPESLQETERGEQMYENIEQMDDFYDQLTDICDALGAM